MTLTIGLTGGIATGKSIVAKIFRSFGIPIYNSDKRAQWLMRYNIEVKNNLVKKLGNIYNQDGSLDKNRLRQIVFSDSEKREIINSIVHPAVNKDFEQWVSKANSIYVIKESALLFESGNYKSLNYNIVVYTPYKLKIYRLMERDKITEQEAIKKINSQMDDKEKIKLADFVIINDTFTPLLPQVLNLHKFFLIHSI